jgi:hypothetical protein
MLPSASLAIDTIIFPLNLCIILFWYHKQGCNSCLRVTYFYVTNISYHSASLQPWRVEGCQPVTRLPSRLWYFIWTLAESYFGITNKVATVALELPTPTLLLFHSVLPLQPQWAEGHRLVPCLPSRW